MAAKRNAVIVCDTASPASTLIPPESQSATDPAINQHTPDLQSTTPAKILPNHYPAYVATWFYLSHR